MQVLGEVAGSDRSLEVGHSKPHLDLQQAQGVQSRARLCLFPYTRAHWRRWVEFCPQVKSILLI